MHRAPRVFSLSCFYPMTTERGAVDVGTPVLAAFLGSELTRELPSEWGVYAMATKIPFQPEALAGYNFLTMDGSVQFEGVYVGNATLAEATASAAPIMGLMPEYQTQVLRAVGPPIPCAAATRFLTLTLTLTLTLSRCAPLPAREQRERRRNHFGFSSRLLTPRAKA